MRKTGIHFIIYLHAHGNILHIKYAGETEDYGLGVRV